MKLLKQISQSLLVAASLAACGSAVAGPVILGGDDLNDHGSWNGTANLLGWKYIQNALTNLTAQVTRPGNNGTIVVLGSSSTGATTTSGNGCGAATFPAQAIGKTVTCIDTAANINAFFCATGKRHRESGRDHISGRWCE